jgi:uncharacterized UBP type Zn finger protein
MLTDERYKQLMEQVGMPNSRSLLQALQQAVMEAELAERQKFRDNLHELKTVLRECELRIGEIDNGKCAACGIAHRLWISPGVAGKCENERCLSHRISEALA